MKNKKKKQLYVKEDVIFIKNNKKVNSFNLYIKK